MIASEVSRKITQGKLVCCYITTILPLSELSVVVQDDAPCEYIGWRTDDEGRNLVSCSCGGTNRMFDHSFSKVLALPVFQATKPRISDRLGMTPPAQIACFAHYKPWLLLPMHVYGPISFLASYATYQKTPSSPSRS